MAGKRLLDAALFFNGASKVGSAHLRLRSDQLDVWTKTSSIGKAVKGQTDRVTLTVRAARALSNRLNEDAPQYVWNSGNEDTRAGSPGAGTQVPRQESVDNAETQRDDRSREGLQQDHHYKREEENATSQPAPADDLVIKQKDAARSATPDGTIPPVGAPVDSEPVDQSKPKDINAAVSGDRPQAAVPPKEPLAKDTQGQTHGLEPKAATEPVSHDALFKTSRNIPENEGVPEQDEELPEGINTDVFFSPKLSKKFGSNAKNKVGGGLGLRMPSRTPIERTPLQQDKGQDTFNIREDGGRVENELDSSARPVGPKSADAGVERPTSNTQSQQQEIQKTDENIQDLAADLAKESSASGSNSPSEPAPYEMHESRVPSSRFGRLWQYAGLGTSMAFGAVGETFRRATGSGSGGSLMLSAANMERLVAKLSRMRGAALKLGQMLSFQDSKMLPEPIQEVLQRVQDNADYMPASQRNRVLSSNLGASWSDLFSNFEEKPFAAASIGQVHRATLASTNTPVAVKIQYPGVASSISSDLSNLSILLTASQLLPKGLYLDKTIANARTELAWETDYAREAACQQRFRDLLASETDTFTVPGVISEASGDQVLTSELMHGTAVTKPSLNLTQSERDWIGTQILRLCLRELTEFRFMQTDPNWTNFLFNKATNKLELLDFGAAREYPAEFVDPYVRVLVAAAHGDRRTVRDLSVQLGYLTGHESQAMVDAHLASVMTLSEPFAANAGTGEEYDFRDQTITDRVRAQIPVMLRERLAPPPEETYSLHRKLSGAFLLLARLGSRVRCRDLFADATAKWEQRQKADAAA